MILANSFCILLASYVVPGFRIVVLQLLFRECVCDSGTRHLFYQSQVRALFGIRVRAEFGITEPARGFDECIGPALDSTEKVRR